MKKQLAGILALAMSLSMAACSSDTGSGETPANETTTTAAAAQNETTEKADEEDSAEAEGDTEASQEEKQEPAKDVKYPTAMSMLRDVELENKNIKILSFYGWEDLPQAAVELFEQKYGGTVTLYETLAPDLSENLAGYIKNGEGIDLIPDYLMLSQLTAGELQPVDSYIDLNSDIWQNTKKAMEAYNFGGKHYELVTGVSPAYYCFYNKKTIEEHGFDDPWELYKAGNWNWDTFESMLSDFVNQGGLGLCDFYFGQALSRSAGVPFAEVSDGRIVSNAGDQALKNAVDFGMKLNNNGLVVSHSDVFPSSSNLNNGDQLFYITYSGELTSTGISDNLGVVPVPSPAGSDPYQYTRVNEFNGYNLCKDAQNPEGAVLFAECIIAANNDPEAISQKWKGNFDLSDEIISQLNEIDDLASRYPVIDLSDMSLEFCDSINSPIIANTYFYGKASDLSIIDTAAAAIDESLQAALAGME